MTRSTLVAALLFAALPAAALAHQATYRCSDPEGKAPSFRVQLSTRETPNADRLPTRARLTIKTDGEQPLEWKTGETRECLRVKPEAK